MKWLIGLEGGMVEIESAQIAVCQGRDPMVTVAMPIYNAGGFLRLAVLSVIAQTYSDWEFLIIDDGSTDNALADISDILDQRIRIIRDGVNRGLGARLNQAIDLARGKYFARMDQDDISFCERFEYQVKKLESEPTLDLVAVRSIAISEENELLGILPFDLSKNDICTKPWRGFYLVHPTWMGRIDWFRKHRYAAPAPYFCEDQELLLRTCESSNFDIVPLELFAYRLRGEVVWKKQAKTRIAVLLVQLRHFSARGQIGFSALALGVFISRLAMDIFLDFTNGKRISPPSNFPETAARWKAILDGIRSTGGGQRRPLE